MLRRSILANNLTRKVLPIAEYEAARESYLGWCRDCMEFCADAVGPDAQKYDCPQCGEAEVYGAEEALMMGLFEVEG